MRYITILALCLMPFGLLHAHLIDFSSEGRFTYKKKHLTSQYISSENKVQIKKHKYDDRILEIFFKGELTHSIYLPTLPYTYVKNKPSIFKEDAEKITIIFRDHSLTHISKKTGKITNPFQLRMYVHYIKEFMKLSIQEQILLLRNDIQIKEEKKVQQYNKNYYRVGQDVYYKQKAISYIHIPSIKIKDNYPELLFDKTYVIIKGEQIEIHDDIQLDIDSFEIIEKNYFKDKSNVFFTGKQIKNASPSSFKVINGHYSKDQNNVYYDGQNFNNLDPKTFQILSKNTVKDKSEVYISGQKIVGADSKTFKALPYNYSKDKNHVYNFNRILKQYKTTDDFKVISNKYTMYKNSLYYYDNLIASKLNKNKIILISDNYITDKRDVFYKKKRLKNINSKKARLLKKERAEYITDGNKIFYKDKVIKNADLKTFKILKHDLAQDNKKLYLRGKVIKTSDSKSFKHVKYKTETKSFQERLNRHDSEDKNNIYFSKQKRTFVAAKDFKALNSHYHKTNKFALYKGKKIRNVDLETFEAISTIFAKDKNSIYHKNKINNFADPKTFTLIAGEYYKDKKHIYRKTEKYKNISIDGFRIVNNDYVLDKYALFYKGFKVQGISSDEVKQIPIKKRNKKKDNKEIYSNAIKIIGRNGYSDKLLKSKKHLIFKGKILSKIPTNIDSISKHKLEKVIGVNSFSTYPIEKREDGIFCQFTKYRKDKSGILSHSPDTRWTLGLPRKDIYTFCENDIWVDLYFHERMKCDSVQSEWLEVKILKKDKKKITNLNKIKKLENCKI